MLRKRLSDLWPFERRATHAILAGIAFLLAVFFVYFLRSIFTPFLIALILAYILNPVMDFGERLRIPRAGMTVILYILFLLIGLFFIFIIGPSVLHETKNLLAGVELHQISREEIVSNLRNYAIDLVPPSLHPEASELVNTIVTNSYEGIRYGLSLLGGTLSVMGQGFQPFLFWFAGFFIDLLFVAFYLAFLLNSLEKLWIQTSDKLIPYEHKERFGRITKKIHLVISAFFRGRTIVCLIIGFIAWIGFMLLHVPFAFPLGFGIGFATIVPFAGLAFLFPAVGFALLSGAQATDIVLIVTFYTLLQGFEMFILTPFLLGREVELHPVALVMSLLIFGSLFGVMGVLLAIPLAATGKIMFLEFVYPSFEELSKKEEETKVDYLERDA